MKTAMAPGYYCSNCSAVYANLRNLNRHLSSHDANLWFSCQYCVFSSKRRDNLKRHLFKYHAVIKSSATDLQPLPVIADQVQPFIKSAVEAVPSVPIETHVGNNKNLTREFDKRLQLPHNFIFAGATQSVSLYCSLKLLSYLFNIFSG